MFGNYSGTPFAHTYIHYHIYLIKYAVPVGQIIALALKRFRIMRLVLFYLHYSFVCLRLKKTISAFKMCFFFKNKSHHS